MNDVDKIIAKVKQLKDQGQFDQALSLLENVSTQPPFSRSRQIWWELAQLYEEPQKKRKAVVRTLSIDSNFQSARDLLVKLNTQANEQYHINKNSRVPQDPIVAMLQLVLVAIILTSITIVGLHYVLQQLAHKSASEGFTTPVLVASPTHEIIFPQAILIESTQLEPTALVTFPASLPTIVPQATEVNAEVFATEFVASDRVVFGSTFGIPRFYEAPIRFFFDISESNNQWNEIALIALNQLDEILPVVETSNFKNADVIVKIVSAEEYLDWSGCPSPELTVGCGWIVAERIKGEHNDEGTIYKGYVWLSSDTSNPIGSLLHEIVHSIGISAHTSSPLDIMYSVATNNITLSPNDTWLIKSHYGLP